jgi:hypothetical protein
MRKGLLGQPDFVKKEEKQNSILLAEMALF